MDRKTMAQSQIKSYQRFKKKVLDASFLCTKHYKVRMKIMCSNPRKGVASSPTSRCSSNGKGTFGLLSITVGQLTIYIYI